MKAVAFLRAVNVGGTGRVPMAELKALAEDIGLAEPATLLQSGNLVFEAGGKTPDALEKLLEREIAKTFKVETDIMVRTSRQLKAAIERNPFSKEAKNDPARLHVHFLKTPAKPAAVAALTKAIKGPESVKGTGGEIVIYYPDGAGNSKLTNAVIERHLGARGTSRNWNTVTKLAEMT
ncbi:MAG TPA: DUF1697 domain-containing protein [Rhizomicrobium sp.]